MKHRPARPEFEQTQAHGQCGFHASCAPGEFPIIQNERVGCGRLRVRMKTWRQIETFALSQSLPTAGEKRQEPDRRIIRVSEGLGRKIPALRHLTDQIRFTVDLGLPDNHGLSFGRSQPRVQLEPSKERAIHLSAASGCPREEAQAIDDGLNSAVARLPEAATLEASRC
jgi:hypothetical protein